MRFLNEDFPEIANWCNQNVGLRGIDWVLISRDRFFFNIDIKDNETHTIFKLKFSDIEVRKIF